MAKLLNKDENKTHALPGTLYIIISRHLILTPSYIKSVIIAAHEDKSWRVRLALAKNFAELTEAFGKEITDMSLI